MIIKYNEYIKENASTNQFFKTYKETKEWLDEMKIKKYTINEDLTVDVDGDVDLSHEELTYIPVKFGKVEGYFYCFYNKLTTLEGSPNKVEGDFYCFHNKLTSLKYSPKEVHNFNCSGNELTSLKYSPEVIDGNLYINSNYITSFIGLTKNITGSIYAFGNDISSLEGLPILNLKKSINIDWYKKLNPKIKENYFDKNLKDNPEIISLINFETTEEFKEKWNHFFNANKFDLI